METIKRNKLYILGAAAIGMYYYSTQMTQEEFKAAIALKEQELRDFMQAYLVKNRSRVGMDIAIKPLGDEITKMIAEYKEKFKADYPA